MRKISLGSLLFVLFVLLTLFPVTAHAALLYEQATLETSDRGAYQYFDQQLADDFVPIVSEHLVTVTWRGSYYDADNLSAAEYEQFDSKSLFRFLSTKATMPA
jgi:hypothetical protein